MTLLVFTRTKHSQFLTHSFTVLANLPPAVKISSVTLCVTRAALSRTYISSSVLVMIILFLPSALTPKSCIAQDLLQTLLRTMNITQGKRKKNDQLPDRLTQSIDVSSIIL